MAPVAVNENYLKTLQVFGDVNEQLNVAVEGYLTRRIIERLKTIRERLDELEARYGTSYRAFMERMQLDEEFYNQTRQANVLWEQDALEWMYWNEELRDWTEKLDAFSKKS